MAILLVFIGGGLGSVFRFLTNELFAKCLGLDKAGFVYSTLLVNVAGSLVAGVIFFLAINNMDASDTKRLFIMAGFCGGFTTFSGFSLEVFKMLQSGDALKALLYVAVSVVFSVAAVAAGFFASRTIIQ